MIELKKLDDVPQSEQNTPLYRWARLIAAKDWKEVCEVANGDTYLEAARDVMDKINQDRVERYLYLRREMAYTDEISRMETAEKMGLEQGMEKGMKEGMKEGIKEGIQRVNNLNIRLIQENRFEDLEKAAKDEVYREQLFKEFDL